MENGLAVLHSSACDLECLSMATEVSWASVSIWEADQEVQTDLTLVFIPSVASVAGMSTFLLFPDVICSASKPPGPRLLLRDFLLLASALAAANVCCVVGTSPAFSLSTPSKVTGSVDGK